MLSNPLIRALTFTALLALAAVPLACKSTEGHDRAANTADQVVLVGGAAGQTQLRLDNTLAALENIVATSKNDPKPAFTTFAKELASFNGEFANLTKQRATLKSQADAWFTEFAKQNDTINDPAMKKAGTERLEEFQENMGEISKAVDGLVTSTTAESARLEDLRKFLGNDLTAKGIETASDSIGIAVKDGRKIAAGLGKLSKSSSELASRMRAAREQTTK